MYLKEIERRPVQGVMAIAFKKLREAGSAVPQIMHLFRFKKRSTNHLVKFTEEVLRGPSPLSRGLRELIGSYVSYRSQCSFCSCAHAPVAAQLLGQDVVTEVLRDVETSRLDAKHKQLFRYVGKLAENPAQITATDIAELKEVGWSEEEIYDALTVASLFKFYNTWNNGSGVQNMSSADYTHSSDRIVKLGYCMDFSFLGTLKVMWRGRKEIKFSDFTALFKMLFKRGSTVEPTSPPATSACNPICPATDPSPLPAAPQ